jgi:type VI secretion system secreted protein Hcp
MAVDYFLKIEGLEGESKDHKHKGEIDLQSWSFGATNGGAHSSGGGGGAGKVSMQDFHFVMETSKASPKLLLACATGQHIKKAVLVTRKAGTEQQEFFSVTFTDILISSYQTGGSAHGGEKPTEQISFNFAKIEFEYKEQKADGTLGGPIKSGYDVKANKAI